MSAAQEVVVVDASVLVDLLAGTEYAAMAADRLRGTVMHAPAHVDAEVLSALGRLQRADALSTDHVQNALRQLETVPLTRHLLPPLLPGAWRLRGSLRLLDALYVELAESLNVTLLTTDQRMTRAHARAEFIGA